MPKAQELGAILLSLNGDFADIVAYPPGQFGGVVALQIHDHPEITPAVVDRRVFYAGAHPRQRDYRGKLLLVEAHRLRVGNERACLCLKSRNRSKCGANSPRPLCELPTSEPSPRFGQREGGAPAVAGEPGEGDRAPKPESRIPILILNYEELAAFCDQDCGDKRFRSCLSKNPRRECRLASHKELAIHQLLNLGQWS